MEVGSLVECVNDSFSVLRQYNELQPVKGNIYTVREIVRSEGIRLEEIRNVKHQYKEGYGEIAFYIHRFRELQSPMDISELIEECLTITI